MPTPGTTVFVAIEQRYDLSLSTSGVDEADGSHGFLAADSTQCVLRDGADEYGFDIPKEVVSWPRNKNEELLFVGIDAAVGYGCPNALVDCLCGPVDH